MNGMTNIKFDVAARGARPGRRYPLAHSSASGFSLVVSWHLPLAGSLRITSRMVRGIMNGTRQSKEPNKRVRNAQTALGPLLLNRRPSRAVLLSRSLVP